MSVISRSQWRRAVSSTNQGSSIVSTPASEAGNPFEIVPEDQEVDEVKEIVKDVKSRHGGVSNGSFSTILGTDVLALGTRFTAVCQRPLGIVCHLIVCSASLK
jgi:hypothetical protein